MLSSFSHVWLFPTLQRIDHKSMGFSRQEHRSGLPFPSPKLGMEAPILSWCKRPWQLACKYGPQGTMLLSTSPSCPYKISSLECGLPVTYWSLVEYGLNDNVGLLRPGHKKPCSFCLGLLGQWSTNFLARGTSFMEDSFSMDGESGGVGLGMIQVHYIYCATLFLLLLH